MRGMRIEVYVRADDTTKQRLSLTRGHVTGAC